MNKNIKELKVIVLTFLSEYFNVVVLLFVVFILVLGFFFVISPKRETISTDLAQINNDKLVEKEKLEDLQKKINMYQRSYTKINEIGRKKINLMLPEEPRAGEIMVQLEELARKKGLIVDSIKVVPRENKVVQSRGGLEGKIGELPPGVGAIDISFDVQGINYKSMKDLLDEFENNMRLMDITNLGFGPNNNNLSLTIVTYYSK